MKNYDQLVHIFKTALNPMTSDEYTVLIRADKRPVGEHKRRFNAPQVTAILVVIVDSECTSRDIINNRRIATSFLWCTLVIIKVPLINLILFKKMEQIISGSSKTASQLDKYFSHIKRHVSYLLEISICLFIITKSVCGGWRRFFYKFTVYSEI